MRFYLAMFISLAGVLETAAAPPPATARQTFETARLICAEDRARLWGVTICGPMVIVDPQGRGAVASQPDPDGRFTVRDGVFVGTLPSEVILTNSAVMWGGQRWTELLWPLPEQADASRINLAHELFHRIQPDLGLMRPEPANSHLEGIEARTLLQLEWRALDSALAASGAAARRRATLDAIAFRRERYRTHAGAAAAEAALEVNEGLAAYTGARLGLPTVAARMAWARKDIAAAQAFPNYIRTFAYGTGPAYGLLLDQAAPAWRASAGGPLRLDEQLQRALRAGDDQLPNAADRARAYGGDDLLAAETARHAAQQAKAADFKARLVDGPRLIVPTKGANRQFNPQTILSLPPFGLVYPTLRLSGPWGVLEVAEGGALMLRDGGAAVPLPGASPDRMQGVGWTLSAAAGWRIVPGERAGDYQLAPPEPLAR